MKIIEILLELLVELPGNPNRMDKPGRRRLHNSRERFGFVQPLVVRALNDGRFEIVSHKESKDG